MLKAQAPLVRAWFARHPDAAKGVDVEFLLGKGELRDDTGAAALAPPYAPDTLLAALLPPPTVVPFGERMRAEPGVTYLHQVERALDILVESRLSGEPWRSRLGALLAHPVRAVRRASALAAVRRQPEDIPVAALLERLAAAAEHPDVRSAAVLALSVTPDPAVRVLLLGIGGDPGHSAFTAAVSRLADVDDGFALELWKDLDASRAGPSAQAFLVGERKRLAERIAARDAASLARRVHAMLTLASYVDVGCHPLETTLVPWTLRTLGGATKSPEVRAALEALTKDGPPLGDGVGQPDLGRVDRVRRYARDILSQAAEPARAR